jgi:hypothetical protein
MEPPFQWQRGDSTRLSNTEQFILISFMSQVRNYGVREKHNKHISVLRKPFLCKKSMYNITNTRTSLDYLCLLKSSCS